MILLDTDHLTALKYPENPRGRHLAERLGASPAGETVGISIVTVEEQMRGWLSAVAKERRAQWQVLAYRELTRLFEYFQMFHVIPFCELCADQSERLQEARVRIGAMDLKIAATALVHRALLLSANLRHFERVPGLNVQNWLDSSLER